MRTVSQFVLIGFAMTLLGCADIQARERKTAAQPAQKEMKEMEPFSGLYMNLGNLPRLSDAKSRSISAENPKGEKGKGATATEGEGANAARELGQGWKVAPCVTVDGHSIFTMADIDGPGAIQSMWVTGNLVCRDTILRIYWDGQKNPSVEVPLGDFFCTGWGPVAQINSLPVAVNPGSAMNCYWLMPFQKHCRITLENRDNDKKTLYYQVNYTLTEIPQDCAYFHAQFHRSNPLPYKEDFTILDQVTGKGHYVGTYIAWGVNSGGWWGEGEIKFYIDGDDKYPTICGTGTEDYFGGSYGFQRNGQYVEYSTPFLGMPQVIRPDGVEKSQQRFGLYRWHIMDPIRFDRDLRVTIQSLGWATEGRYRPRQDDIASVAYWYQTLPTPQFPELPGRDDLSVY